MRRFQFRLESVLGWRRVELELEEGRLEALFTERRRWEADTAEIEVRRGESEKLIDAQTLEGQELVAMIHHRRYLERETARIAAARADCEKRIAAQRQRVLEAERKVRLLERLKERRLAEWTFEANRELEALAAETFLSKWVREKSQN
jgi:hypothetical protein